MARAYAPGRRRSIGIWGLPVRGSRRDYPSDAAARIRNVSLVAWNYVDMSVRHRLTGRLAVVHPDIEPVGSVLLLDDPPRLPHRLPYSRLNLSL